MAEPAATLADDGVMVTLCGGGGGGGGGGLLVEVPPPPQAVNVKIALIMKPSTAVRTAEHPVVKDTLTPIRYVLQPKFIVNVPDRGIKPGAGEVHHFPMGNIPYSPTLRDYITRAL